MARRDRGNLWFPCGTDQLLPKTCSSPWSIYSINVPLMSVLNFFRTSSEKWFIKVFKPLLITWIVFNLLLGSYLFAIYDCELLLYLENKIKKLLKLMLITIVMREFTIARLNPMKHSIRMTAIACVFRPPITWTCLGKKCSFYCNGKKKLLCTFSDLNAMSDVFFCWRNGLSDEKKTCAERKRGRPLHGVFPLSNKKL